MRTIWYMGAKTRLTEDIAQAVQRAAPGAETVLDLMSGTAAVSQALAPKYRVVANDVQEYAATIAKAYLCHGSRKAAFLRSLDPERDLGARFRENQAALLDLLAPAVAVEDAFLQAYGFEVGTADASQEDGQRAAAPSLLGVEATGSPSRRLPKDPGERARAYRAFALSNTPSFHEERDIKASGVFRRAQTLFRRETIAARRDAPRAFPYVLSSSYYPNVYLGLRQAIAVDSLRYAIDGLRGRHAAAKRTHYLAALLHAASVTTSATSHFCQPRGLVRDSEVKAVLARRAVSISSRMLAFSRSIAELVAGTELRGDNAARHGDWREAFRAWDSIQADVVYADPPYTADNYSRFYHVLEVLTRYDYPELQVLRGRTTKGRYPAIGRRHRSPFCAKRKVEGELSALIAAAAERGAALVLSYGEENGLLLKTYRERGESRRAALSRFAGLARAHYRTVELERRQLLHSGQGDSNQQITELLLIARGPRGRGKGRGR